ncbi:hypothetical protein QJS10_CPA06g01250 [Acorus calamus]|uniref:Sieve element occlusion C-terminal domain-containing protein n=1 Tax=Acorus calamus TaxID=4465 RepID=A0AAV9EJI9_ACOCL|nr:hypothetical protein QJS10_CPA06g01250 [Acorus calamus]
MQEVMQMMSFDGSEEGWAVVSRGSAEIVKAHGRKIVDCLGKFEEWKGGVEKDGFVPALRAALVPYETHEHCTRLILPGDTGRIQDNVICAECRKPMENTSYNDLQRMTEVAKTHVVNIQGACDGSQAKENNQEYKFPCNLFIIYPQK